MTGVDLLLIGPAHRAYAPPSPYPFDSAEKFNNDGLPVVDAWPSGRPGRQLAKMHCRYCNGPHFHGLLAGHRVAHCTDRRSPYKTKGYFLRLMPADPSTGRSA